MDYYLKTSKNINKDQKNPDLSLSIESTCPSKEREREREREKKMFHSKIDCLWFSSISHL